MGSQPPQLYPLQLCGACLAPSPGGLRGCGLENVGGEEGALSEESGTLSSHLRSGNQLCVQVTSCLASVVPIYPMRGLVLLSLYGPVFSALPLGLWAHAGCGKSMERAMGQ